MDKIGYCSQNSRVEKHPENIQNLVSAAKHPLFLFFIRINWGLGAHGPCLDDSGVSCAAFNLGKRFQLLIVKEGSRACVERFPKGLLPKKKLTCAFTP